MPSKIGLISDVHTSPEPLRQALEIFNQQHVCNIICAGDIAGYFDELSETIKLLQTSGCDTIIGNHDQSFLADNPGLKNTDDYQYLSI